MSVVYFAKRDDGYVKIGYSRSVQRRMSGLQSSGGPITLLCTLPGGAELERHLHERFSDYRVSGEWFQFSEEISDFVTQIQNGGAPQLAAGMDYSHKNNNANKECKHSEEARSQLIALCGDRDWNDNRKAWIAKGAKVAGITYAAARSIFYRENRSLRADTADKIRSAYLAKQQTAFDALGDRVKELRDLIERSERICDAAIERPELLPDDLRRELVSKFREAKQSVIAAIDEQVKK